MIFIYKDARSHEHKILGRFPKGKINSLSIFYFETNIVNLLWMEYRCT